MDIQVGDLVVRKSHGGDIVFKVAKILVDETQQTHCVLKGLHLRLMADSPIDDLERIEAEHLRKEIVRMESIHNDTMRRVMMRRSREREQVELRRSETTKKYTFFDLPGRVLHLDGDEEYLKMCLKTYSQLNIQAEGRWVEESKQADIIIGLLEEIRPDILVLTGHDALVGHGKKDISDINNYRNSRHFVAAVKKARQFEPSRDDLVIFAGACQSHFEAILSSGANFASSPNRIFIHAYDPVFIAEKVAFTPINRTVEVSDAITASVTGVDGVGGLETRGKFRLGMPKTPIK
ncbi:sporulation peptidase YabG [Sporomusa acidovorans]|uniref:Sporulation-specific protease YabG n=1 Tax=Sporomusa acidovorans (strain ATCC 49682 / DSM 3132 / Mol) TaxID=1123286 RepID=A0ABZ3IWL2_SPOA4|nr:sporulation peptidase YabG [Sporomusa acidovorans]OZC14011.1 sporulation-specific protease YabG [Sporomusa acidovorans DSM 3132]SDF22329.1 spore coat assemly protein [Sporomusa acidovorans]